MPLPAYYTYRRIVGLALEAWLHHLARKERGIEEDAPTSVRVKEQGAYVERDRTFDAFIGRALDEVGPIARKVVAAIGTKGVRLRGARCLGVRRGDRNWRCVDLRVRYRGRRALVEVKWSPKRLAKARRGALRELAKLRALRGGRWRGKHPRAGKRIQAPYVGALCVCQGAWRLELWEQSVDDDHPDVDHSGRIRFQSQLSGAAKRRKYAGDDDPEDEEAGDAGDDADSSDSEGEQDDDAADDADSPDLEGEQDDGTADDADSPDLEGEQDDGAADDVESDSSDGSC